MKDLSHRDSLIHRIRDLCRPIPPVATGERPRLPASPLPARTLIFDIYGTLLVSASGDVGTTAQDSSEALAEALAETGLSADPGTLAEALHEAIAEAHARARERGVDHPEIDIRDCWSSAFARCGLPVPERIRIERLAVEYECRINPVWPMPGAARLIEELVGQGRHLGLLSNAQFYTPLVIEALFGKSVEALGFEPELCLWSWQTGHGKPSPWLFATLSDRLPEGDVPLYVGNDMLKDIWPASRVGWHTVLFAGDARSLRKREGDPRVRDVRPDAVITELLQIMQIME